MLQQGDDPPVLLVGTEVSAKYKGAFCEAKIRKVVRSVKCRVVYKSGSGPNIVSDEQIVEGDLRVGETVQIKLPDKKDPLAATLTKIQDGSHYTVVFDDGDITTLRRSALCLKSGRHFNASETLDQLPLTHPEHFGNPVMGGRRGRRHQEESSEEEEDEDEQPVKAEKEENIGKVVCIESTETKKKSQKENWFPGLVVAPTAQDTVRIRVKEEYLVRSFKDGRYYTVPKKEATEFTRDLAKKQENNGAVQAALEYLDMDTLPPHWDRDVLFGLSVSCSECEVDLESDSSDDEPREEKDHFVAQLYKYMDDRGTPLNKGPQISNKDIDLYRLFRAAQKLGGYNRVTSQNQWKAIAIRLGFASATNSVTNLVKQAYKKFLQPFEDFNRKLGCTMVAHPRANRIKGRSLVRASSVASPKPGGGGGPGDPAIKSMAGSSSSSAGAAVGGNEEYENTSESGAETTTTPGGSGTVAVVAVTSSGGGGGRGNKKPRKLSMTSVSGGTPSGKQGKQQQQRDDPEDNEPIVQPVQPPVRGKPGPKPKHLQQQLLLQQQQQQQQQQLQLQMEKEKAEEIAAASITISPGGALGKRQNNSAKSESIPESPSTAAASSSSSSSPNVAKTPKGRGMSESSVSTPSVPSVGKGRKKKEIVAPTVAAAPPPPPVDDKSEAPKLGSNSSNSSGGGNVTIPEKSDEKKEKKDSESSCGGNGSAPTDNKGGTVVTAGTAVADDFPVEVGDKLKVFYHEKKVTYEAKVLEISADNLYLVHYTGWNTRYDEWVPKARIAENLTSKQKRTKGGVIVKSSSSGSAANTPNTMHGKMGTGASKRGRGGSRSDSLPPRSTTPCSVTSNSSRTKSPATPAQHRRTTRGQPNTLRRTSNNTDISSMQTDDSDTDSDEPVKKPTRSSSLALPPGRSVLDSLRKDSKDASSSNNEDEATKDFMEYIDIDQMRSDMKEVLKSPSPDADQSPTSSVHLDHKTSLFHLSDSNTDSNELKASKESGSSDTQSEDEEDSQGAFVGKKGAAVMKGRAKKEVVGGRKSGVEKESSLSKILGTDSSILSEKDMKVEVMLVDVAKKGGLGLKGSLLGASGVKTGEKLPAATGRKSTGEKLGPLPVVKQEKGVVAVGKAASTAKTGFGGVASSVDAAAGEVKVKKDDPSDSDVYEFKEPEPFEFEAAATTSRKPMNTPAGGAAAAASAVNVSPEEVKPGPAGKGKKRLLDLEAKNNLSPQTTPTGKKVKRSPGKVNASTQQLATPPEKVIKKEEGASDPFDVLRKSPNFNVPSGGALESLPEFTQKLSSTDGFQNPVSSASSTANNLATISSGGGPALGLGLSPMKLANAASQSSLVSSAFVNTRNDDDQWQSLRMFKSAVEGHGIDMEDVLAKTKVMKEVHPQQKGGGGGGGNNSSGSGSEFEGKTERGSIADKFLKTLNHGGSSNSSSPSSSGEGPSGGVTAAAAAAAVKSGSIFGRDFADKLEPKMAKKEHLKLDLASAGGVKATGLVSSPDKLDALLELNPPKNNVLSETILKLKSAINDEDDEEGGGGDSESTDSERERLVIEDEEEEDDEEEEEDEDDDEEEEADGEQSQSSEGVKDSAAAGGGGVAAAVATTAEAVPIIDPAMAAVAALVSGLSVKIKEEVTISSVTLKEQSMSFATKFHESFYGSQTTLTPSLVKCETSQTDLTCEESMDEACEEKKGVVAGAGGGGGLREVLEAKESMSVSVLLCEETIPTSPCHQAQRSEKLLLLEERKGTLESRLLGGVKSLGQTPNSSPRDSQSGDESKSDSEDLKKNESEMSAKKRRRGVGGRRSADLETSQGKRRRMGTGTRKGSATTLGGNGGSDSEENSDPLSTGQQLLRRSPKPCQFNFLVQLDPSLSSHQKIAILEKKIQDLRKTYNMIKSDLASIDRRRKKLRRKKKNQLQQQQKAALAVN